MATGRGTGRGGAGASSHVTGFQAFHATLEAQLAGWLGYPRALLFISGFAANQAVIHLLAGKNDRILADKLSHASLLDAASHSPAQLRRFAHNDPDSLAVRLSAPCEGQTLVVTEGIFSMDGDSAPLQTLAAQSREAGAWLLVDDAHGIGVTGEQGAAAVGNRALSPNCWWSPSVKPLASAARHCYVMTRRPTILCSFRATSSTQPPCRQHRPARYWPP